MTPHVAAWQLDIFGDTSPVHLPQRKPDPLPDPRFWSDSVREQMAEELFYFACDSRRADNLPEALADCALLISDRLRNRKVDLADYRATLGWIMEYWNGMIPYRLVCSIGRIRPRVFQDVILDTPLLARDLRELRQSCFGSLL